MHPYFHDSELIMESRKQGGPTDHRFSLDLSTPGEFVVYYFVGPHTRRVCDRELDPLEGTMGTSLTPGGDGRSYQDQALN